MTQLDTYSPEQVAEVAVVTRRTVYRWITSGRLPAHKIGPKMWVVYRQVLMGFMAGKETEKLQNLAASLQGRKTIITAAPVPVPITRPRNFSEEVQGGSNEEKVKTAEEVSNELLQEIAKPTRLVPQVAYNDTDFVMPAKRGTNMQPPKKKKPPR